MSQFREELILLDTKQDKYMVCSSQFSKSLLDLIEEKPLSLKKNPLDSSSAQFLQNPDLHKLIEDHIIEQKYAPYPFFIDRKFESQGVSNVSWRLPLKNAKIHFNIKVLRALILLSQVNFYMKVRGFYATIQLIKKSCVSKDYSIPQEEELRNLANVVNKACLIYPTRTKCLEWAITYVLLALKKRWRCNLEIGVQNYPFSAHAWVECNGKVVMDSQDLRKGLAIILNEPFRK